MLNFIKNIDMRTDFGDFRDCSPSSDIRSTHFCVSESPDIELLYIVDKKYNASIFQGPRAQYNYVELNSFDEKIILRFF